MNSEWRFQVMNVLKVVIKFILLDIIMGQICSNPLQYLIEEYGEDVGKFVVVEKTKQFFDEKYPEVKNQLKIQTTNFQKEVLHDVDEKSSSCITKVTSSLDELKTAKKTELELFEKGSDKKVDEIVGVGELQSKLNGLKEESKVKLAGLEKNILGEADALADKQRNVIESKRPSIPLYDKLPQCLKDKVWEEGEKQFGPRINQEKSKTEDMLKNTLNFEQLKKKFGGNLPSDEITNISASAEQNLADLKKKIEMGSSMGSSTGKVKGFFS